MSIWFNAFTCWYLTGMLVGYGLAKNENGVWLGVALMTAASIYFTVGVIGYYAERRLEAMQEYTAVHKLMAFEMVERWLVSEERYEEAEILRKARENVNETTVKEL